MEYIAYFLPVGGLAILHLVTAEKNIEDTFIRAKNEIEIKRRRINIHEVFLRDNKRIRQAIMPYSIIDIYCDGSVLDYTFDGISLLKRWDNPMFYMGNKYNPHPKAYNIVAFYLDINIISQVNALRTDGNYDIVEDTEGGSYPVLQITAAGEKSYICFINIPEEVFPSVSRSKEFYYFSHSGIHIIHDWHAGMHKYALIEYLNNKYSLTTPAGADQ